MSSIFSTLLERLGSTPTFAREGSSDSTISLKTVDDLPVAQSSQSTPPTSIDDSNSISSIVTQSDNQIANSEKHKRPAGKRFSKREKPEVSTYNIKKLSGTDIHTPLKFDKGRPSTSGTDDGRRHTVGGEGFAARFPPATSAPAQPKEKKTKAITSSRIDALDLQLPKAQPKPARGRGRPRKSEVAEQIAKAKSSGKLNSSYIIQKPTVLGKRARDDDHKGMSSRAQRELRKLQDTDEFAKVEKQTVVMQVWSNGKLVTNPNARKVEAPVPRAEIPKVVKPVEPEPEVEELPTIPIRKKEKTYCAMGLYAGQAPEKLDWFKNVQAAPGEDLPPFKPSGALPLPMWHGQRLIFIGRDFKLPFDVCSPLPPGQSRPEGWFKTSSNRFVGDAATQWKHDYYQAHGEEDSKCVCTDEHGCDDNCLNIAMSYECNDDNCNLGKRGCANRAFAQLQVRRKRPDGKKSNKYDIGVEVVKTEDRGYGVRANRTFEPGQIIVEYTGEIINEEECDRRMNEDYKNNECYYLMSFDQHMFLDATKGSIARFVNHSCQPNCRMIKWVVNRKPRMALFAGDGPIMTGDELTYDYNFDPFSTKNVQECRCGSDNCRGILGPKPKDVKQVKDTIKAVVKAPVSAGKALMQAGEAGKRRVMEFLSGASAYDNAPPPKKRKTKVTVSAVVSRPSSVPKRPVGRPRKDQKVAFTPKSQPRQIKKFTPMKSTPKVNAKMGVVKSFEEALQGIAASMKISSETVAASKSPRATSSSKQKSGNIKSPARSKKTAEKIESAQSSPRAAPSLKNRASVIKSPTKALKNAYDVDAALRSPRSSPKKPRRARIDEDDSDGEYFQRDDGRDAALGDIDVRTSGRKRRAIFKEDSGTIHVISTGADKDVVMD